MEDRTNSMEKVVLMHTCDKALEFCLLCRIKLKDMIYEFKISFTVR